MIWTDGTDLKLQQQYKFPREAEDSVQATIDVLVEQEVLVEVNSTCKSMI